MITETLVLEDKMSEPLSRARKEGESFGQWMARIKAQTADANKSLADTATSVASVGAAATSAATPLAAVTQRTALVATTAKGAAHEFDLLSKGLTAAQSAMVKANAVGDFAGFDKAAKRAGVLQEAIGKINPELLAQGQAEKKQAADSKALGAQASADATKHAVDTSRALDIARDAAGAFATGIKSAFTSLASGDVKGAVMGLTDALAGTAKMLDMVVPGLGQAVSLLISIGGGFVAMTAGMVKSGVEFTISCVESKNAAIALFDALGQGAITGGEVDDMLDDLRSKLGVTKDMLSQFTAGFMKMGITGKESLESLTTAAVSAEALVKGGGDAFVAMQQKINDASEAGQKLILPFKKLGPTLAKMGLNTDDLAKRMNLTSKELVEGLSKGTIAADKFGAVLTDAATAKGAGALDNLSNSAANLGAMLKEYIGDLFEDMKEPVGAFMKEVKGLFSIFESKTTPSGMALKTGIAGGFTAILGAATKAVPYIKHFLLDLVILGLKAYIGLKPIIKWAQEMAQKQPVIDAFKNALLGIGLAIASFAAPIIGAIAVVGLLVAAFVAIGVTVSSAVGGIVKFGVDAFKTLNGYIEQAKAFGNDFVQGIIDGLGAGPLIAAVTGLATSAKDTFKSVLGIASPSKVMALEGGGPMAAGVVEGLESGEKDVASAASSVATVAVKATSDVASSGGGAAAPAASSSSGPVSITIMIDGAGKSAESIAEEVYATLMQRMALGAGV